MAAANAEVADQTVVVPGVSFNVQQKLVNTIQSWRHSNQNAWTLVVEPCATERNFVGGAKRFVAGDFAGSSAAIMHLKLTDGDSDKLTAEPEYNQRAAAEGGTWTFRAIDKAMLVRIATVAQQCLQHDHAQAVGGSTGVDGTETK